VADPEPSGLPATWRTYRACLERAPRTGHLVIVQDDARLAAGFRQLVAAAVAECPCRVLCLFLSPQARRTAPDAHRAYAAGERFVRLHPLDHFVPTVAVAWPVDAARAVAAWADRRRWGVRQQRADDAIVKDACVGLGLEPWATVPSLVEHDDDIRSLVDGRGYRGPRRSRQAIYAHGSLHPPEDGRLRGAVTA